MSVTQTKAEFNEVVVEHGEMSCRACLNFVRVRDDIRNAHHMRGFCRVGRLEGDYSLYLSSSEAHDCKALVLDDYNLETLRKEKELHDEFLELKEKVRCGQTREHKLMKEFAEKSRDIICKDKKSPMEHSIIFEFFKDSIMFFEWFYSINTDKFKWFHDRRAMRKQEYPKLISNVTNTIIKNIVVDEENNSLYYNKVI